MVIAARRSGFIFANSSRFVKTVSPHLQFSKWQLPGLFN
jgi:hypothetical protein